LRGSPGQRPLCGGSRGCPWNPNLFLDRCEGRKFLFFSGDCAADVVGRNVSRFEEERCTGRCCEHDKWFYAEFWIAFLDSVVTAAAEFDDDLVVKSWTGVSWVDGLLTVDRSVTSGREWNQ